MKTSTMVSISSVMTGIGLGWGVSTSILFDNTLMLKICLASVAVIMFISRTVTFNAYLRARYPLAYNDEVVKEMRN